MKKSAFGRQSSIAAVSLVDYIASTKDNLSQFEEKVVGRHRHGNFSFTIRSRHCILLIFTENPLERCHVLELLS
jgi:hypothetical protein